MEQAIADGVGQGRVGDVVVPLAGRELAGDYVESRVKLLVIAKVG
jgi:hypothetical protein